MVLKYLRFWKRTEYYSPNCFTAAKVLKGKDNLLLSIPNHF